MNNQQHKSQNPLLSCALTGGFDDGGIVVLASAEKPVFTIGAPVNDYSDNLFEVSLDRDANSEVEATVYSSPLNELDSYANLQNLQDTPPTLDINSNEEMTNYQQTETGTGSLTLALNSAASSVFSTFTNIIKGPGSQTKIEDQVQEIPVQNEPICSEHYENMPLQPPAFFSPNDNVIFKKQNVEAPSNTFRLGSNKKKTYAHIPGLSTQPQTVPQNFNLNPVMPPMPPQKVQHIDSTAQFPSQVDSQDNIKTAAGGLEKLANKFSFSSLIPSQLLEKIPSSKNIFGVTDDMQTQGQNYNIDAPNFNQQPTNYFVSPLNNNDYSANYFNPLHQNFNITSTANTSSPQDINAVTQELQYENVTPINIFNSQQFNTAPFQKAEPSASPEASVDNIDVRNDAAQRTSLSQAFSPPSLINESNISQNEGSTMPLTQNIFASEVFSNSPQLMTSNETAPIFFNPAEASTLFKPRQSDDGKQKNPYSNNRVRGVSLYKTRTKSISDSTSVPLTSTNIISTQQLFSLAPPVNLSRPPSNTPSTAVEPLINQMNNNFLPPSTSEVLQKKSDLNIPDDKTEFDQTKSLELHQSPPELQENFSSNSHSFVTPQTNVSNFFDYDSKANEQASALNFYQEQREIMQSSINERVQAQPTAPCDFNQLTPESFSSEKIFSDLRDDKKREVNVFNSTEQQLNENLNDVTDKMESLSSCSRSTLSLFATSEFDSTLGQKQAVESLIPKYLENNSIESSKTSGMNKNYRPIYRHWFFQSLYWHPFSMADSIAIEQALLKDQEIIYTDGGRYEVNIKEKRRTPVYWLGGSNALRKCSWFYTDSIGGNLIPYDENIAELLEKEYEKAMSNDSWNHKINLPDSKSYVIIKNPVCIEHHELGHILAVKRGTDSFDIEDGEEGTPDHLLLCISNFGDKIDNNADEVRSKCLETVQQYYSEAYDCGQIKRIEVLPITINSIDILQIFEIYKTLDNARLHKSVSKEAADNILRTMLYSNENYYQKIMNHLTFSLNEIVSKFKYRNENFDSGISLMSASFEALFLFDLLIKQDASESWKLQFDIHNLFICGMPTALLSIRNSDILKHGFELTKCKKAFFNILHPLDPIGQRIEPLIIPEYAALAPETIENIANERIDYIIPDDSTLEQFTVSRYFSSEIMIKRITNEIYGTSNMDSGSL